MKRLFLVGIILGVIFIGSSGWAQKTTRLSIAAGDRGGIYYLLGGGMAHVISKYIPYVEATVEVPNAPLDSCLWIGKGRADLALIAADTGWNAYQGRASFEKKISLRTLAVLFPNNMQVVTEDGKNIEKVTDLRGKRVSTGAPESRTQKMALRVIEAYGLNPNQDMIRNRLTLTESASALKDKKLDAFFWLGGLPTSAILELSTPPGIRMKLISHAEAIPKMREKYGPIYVKGVIPAKTYPGQNTDVPIAVVWNLLVCSENMKENVAYDIVRSLFDHKPELVLSLSDAKYLSLETQGAGGSPIPFHPGAIRYFTEKGFKIK